MGYVSFNFLECNQRIQDYPNRGPSFFTKQDFPTQQTHIASSYHMVLDAFFQGLPEKAYLSLRAGDVSGDSPEKQTETKVVRWS